jgi:hypothetical protein
VRYCKPLSAQHVAQPAGVCWSVCGVLLPLSDLYLEPLKHPRTNTRQIMHTYACLIASRLQLPQSSRHLASRNVPDREVHCRAVAASVFRDKDWKGMQGQPVPFMQAPSVYPRSVFGRPRKRKRRDICPVPLHSTTVTLVPSRDSSTILYELMPACYYDPSQHTRLSACNSQHAAHLGMHPLLTPQPCIRRDHQIFIKYNYALAYCLWASALFL